MNQEQFEEIIQDKDQEISDLKERIDDLYSALDDINNIARKLL